MNEKLREKLAEDLRTSGFYSEMMAIRACRAAGWDCRGSFTYFDKDERTTRECDFEAVQEWQELRADGSSTKVIARLLGQVKKSERPWIVFADSLSESRRFHYLQETLLRVAAEETLWKIEAVLRTRSQALDAGWTATGIHEAFKKPSDTSKWYSAFVSVCKACETAYEATDGIRADFVAQLIQPVVVLDGLLVAAELTEDGQLTLTETDHAGFRFEYRSDQYDRAAYHPDLVTLDGLPRYFDRAADRMNAILRALESDGAGK
jgi:hypothetical protein